MSVQLSYAQFYTDGAFLLGYPTDLPIAAAAAQVDYATDRQLDRASNGAARVRVFYSAPKRSFQFRHPGLDVTDLSTFTAYYDANAGAIFDFHWPADGVTYSCAFAREPGIRMLGSGLAEVSVVLAQV